MRRDRSGIRLQRRDSDAESLRAVATGEADAFVGNLTLASHLMIEKGLGNLKIAAPTDLEDHLLCFGIRPDWIQLAGIIDKGIETITPEERTAIRSKYLALEYEQGIRARDVLTWGLAVVGAGALLVFLFVVWNRQLARKVGERTAELAASEERFRATFEQAAVGVAHRAPDGSFLRINRKFCDIVGYTRAEMLSRTLRDITYPDDLDADLEQTERLLRGEADTYAMEKRYVRKDGDVVWVNLTVSLVREKSGEPRWFVSVVENITLRKAAEEAFNESATRLRLATAATRIASWDWDLRTGELGFSPEWKLQLGYEDSQLPSRFEEWESRLHPDDHDEMLKAIEEYLEGTRLEYAVEFRLRHKDGSYRWIYTRADKQVDDDGKPVRVFGCHVDITERKEADEARRESEAKFRNIIEQSPVSIQIHGPDGRLLLSNAAYAKLYALNEDALAELYEKYNVLHDEQAERLEVMPFIEKAFAGEEVVFPPYEYDGIDTLKTLDFEKPVSRRCWVQTRGFPLKDEKGNVKSVVFMSEDITERKRTEEELGRYQERLRALASELTIAEEKERRRLAADLHDQVGQMLALARVQLATAAKEEADGRLSPRLAEVSETVLQASQETRRLISDLSSPAMNELGLAAAISDWMSEHVAGRCGIETEFINDFGPSRIDSINDDMRAILFRNVRELLTNVIKYADAGKITVRLQSADAQVKIIVQDDGVGFDPGEVSSVVTREGGFGLFSIQERMADLGGALDIKSAPGKGCTAVLSIPVNRAGGASRA